LMWDAKICSKIVSTSLPNAPPPISVRGLCNSNEQTYEGEVNSLFSVINSGQISTVICSLQYEAHFVSFNI
jgi:hypothetical protein